MQEKLLAELNRVFKLSIDGDMIRYEITKGQGTTSDWINIGHKDRNSYNPSVDGYKWKMLCA